MKVKINKSKNRLYLTLSGNISKKELDTLYTDVRFAVADLEPGFTVVNDLTECRLCHLAGVGIYKKISHYLIRKKVREVVRVIDRESLLLKQFLNFASRFTEYLPVYVYSLEEAEVYLDKSNRKSGLRFHFPGLPPVSYRVRGKEGQGRILDISTSGCEIGSISILPRPDEAIDIAVSFNDGKDGLETLDLKACATRVEDDRFAVTYDELGEETEALLWQCLLREFEQESKTHRGYGLLEKA